MGGNPSWVSDICLKRSRKLPVMSAEPDPAPSPADPAKLNGDGALALLFELAWFDHEVREGLVKVA